jgi:hypothetical protein
VLRLNFAAPYGKTEATHCSPFSDHAVMVNERDEEPVEIREGMVL